MTLTVLHFWIYLFLLTLVFVLQCHLPLFENSDHVVVAVFIDFLSISKVDASFHRIVYDYSRAD